jgi:hypothetical protein
MRIFGHPNLVMMSSNMNYVDVVTLYSLTSLDFSHLVKYSVAVIMYLTPMHFLGGLIGPTKSMDHFSNACKVS